MMQRARQTALASGEDENVIEEYWLQHIDQDQLDTLTEDILGEIERRLCAATRQSSWPVMHRIADTADREDFFRHLRPFYHNHRNLFGGLVTPLVQGIRGLPGGDTLARFLARHRG